MSWSFEFSLRRWSAWAPGLKPPEEWSERLLHSNRSALPALQDEPAKLAFLDPKLRRKCRKLARAALEVAYNCVPAQQLTSMRTVFAARFGESETAFGLLHSI